VKGVLASKICGRRVWQVEFCAKRVFKGGSKKLWRGEALNEFVADPHRHTAREREREV
jgi:hypothetical protein